MHIHAVCECLPIFAAAGHANYLKFAHLYSQEMELLETRYPLVIKKFHDGFHVIGRTEQFMVGLAMRPLPSISVPIAPSKFISVGKRPSNNTTLLIGLSSGTSCCNCDAFQKRGWSNVRTGGKLSFAGRQDTCLVTWVNVDHWEEHHV